MKAEIRTLLRDIQAAARIGHAESLWAALENLQDLPQIAGNHPMNETFLSQVVLPVGETLGQSRISHTALRPLVIHQLAAYRAIAGVALLNQFLEGRNGTTLASINALVQDPRQDVREAIRLAALHDSHANPDKLVTLYENWKTSDSPRVQTLAYQLLPNLPGETALQKIRSLNASVGDLPPEVRVTLAGTLTALAASGHAEEVLEVLVIWAAQPGLDHRIATRCLSKSWAAKYPDESLQILTALAARTGPKKRIRKALESLYRHGADAEVLAVLETWRSAEDANLRASGQDEKLTL